MWWEWGALSGWAGQALINGPDAGGSGWGGWALQTASEAVQKKRATVCLRGSVACKLRLERFGEGACRHLHQNRD